MPKFLVSALFAACALGTVSACGGGSGGSATPPTPSAAPSATAKPSAAPSASPSPGGSATPFPGNATLQATFTANVPVAGKSATFAFASSTGSALGMQTAPLPAGCAMNPSCSVTVSAPTATGTYTILVYGSAAASGTPLAYANVPFTGIANQTALSSVALSGVMAGFTISLTPATVTVGHGAPVGVVVSATDAAGEPLVAGYVTTSYATPAYTLSVNDPTGAVTVPLSSASGSSVGAIYSGIGSGPATFTVAATSYPAQTVTLSYLAASPLAIAYAYAGSGPYNGNPGVSIDALPGVAETPWLLNLPGALGSVTFDTAGTLWMGMPISGTVVQSIGIASNGSAAGTLSLNGSLLAFDPSGDAYALGAQTSTNLIAQYAIAGGTATLVRSFTTASAACSAIVAVGLIYVGQCSNGGPGGVFVYPSTGSGALTPIGGNPMASSPVSSDRAGNVYAAYGAAIGEWTAGGFGNVPPTKTFVYNGALSATPGLLAVDPSGDIFAVYSQVLGNTLVEFPAGSATATVLQQSFSTITSLAAPIR